MAKRKKDSWRVDPADLDPKVAAGLAQGDEEIEEQEERYKAEGLHPSGLQIASHMGQAETVIGSRVPKPRFVAMEGGYDMVTSIGDDRNFRDVNKVFDPETLQAMKAGYICLKCLEPQAFAFEDAHLEGCEGVSLAGPEYMKKRQIMDIAMEFEGETHIGPSKPLKEFFQEQELRREQREFEQRLTDGKSRGIRRG